jgi:hypothetical protein
MILAGPLGRSAATLSHLIMVNFPESRFLPVQLHSRLLHELVDLDLAGGSVYDATHVDPLRTEIRFCRSCPGLAPGIRTAPAAPPLTSP